jgi:VIT1/CCC1 family predicted Fe2+/Mn2+ transporter
MRSRHLERHASSRMGWLRASVLGANDGTISVSGLVLGVAASGVSQSNVLITGVAGLVAGAMSMAAGEYVSVQSQADAEQADLAREAIELRDEPEHELAELTGIFRARGLDEDLAGQVARQLMAKDALGAHARDELGLTESLRARPLQAALASAGSFIVGALVPVAAVVFAPQARIAEVAVGATVVTLVILGGTAARVGGAPVLRGALRVTFWGALAMAMSFGVGKLFGVMV